MQEQELEGIKGAWDGDAANGGEEDRGEGRGARQSGVQRKRQEGGTGTVTLATKKQGTKKGGREWRGEGK